MSHFRVVATMPPPPEAYVSRLGYPLLNQTLPSFADVCIFFVDDDGREHDIGPMVQRVAFEAGNHQGGDPLHLDLQLSAVAVEWNVVGLPTNAAVEAMRAYVRAWDETRGIRGARREPSNEGVPDFPDFRTCTCGDAPFGDPDCPMHGRHT